MNDNEFEDKFRALTEKLARPDPTAAWKTDILSRARQSRETRVARMPRVLLTVLGVAWLLIAVLRLTTPDETSSAVSASATATIPSLAGAPPPMLIAFHANPEFFDLP